MKAFVEFFKGGLVRIGPDADRMGAPYDSSCAFAIEMDEDGTRWAVLKGLAPGSKIVTLDRAKALVAALQAEGLRVRWERLFEDGSFRREWVAP